MKIIAEKKYILVQSCCIYLYNLKNATRAADESVMKEVVSCSLDFF